MNAKDRIRQLMEERHWSEYRLAKEAGLSQSTLSNLFRRHNAPSIATLESICNAFGITLAQFFADGKSGVVLTEEQRMLFDRWIALTEEQKRFLYEIIENIK